MNQIEIVRFNEGLHVNLIEPLTIILHKAYKPLALKGMKFKASHQNEEDTLRRLKKGPSFFAFVEDKIVGTITLVLNDPEETNEWYRRFEVCHFEQFGVDPNYQGLGIGLQLYNTIESHARTHDVKELALDTSENASDLIDFYSRLGFRFIQYDQWPETNYRSVIMSKTLA